MGEKNTVVPSQHKSPHGVLDYLALALATFGVGYLPIAPGTLGSMVGVLIFLAARRLSRRLAAAQSDRNRRGELHRHARRRAGRRRV